MHLPASVKELLPLHGKPHLVLDQVAVLDALRKAEVDDAVSSLIEMFDSHRKGLEQEALLIKGRRAPNPN